MTRSGRSVRRPPPRCPSTCAARLGYQEDWSPERSEVARAEINNGAGCCTHHRHRRHHYHYHHHRYHHAPPPAAAHLHLLHLRRPPRDDRLKESIVNEGG